MTERPSLNPAQVAARKAHRRRIEQDRELAAERFPGCIARKDDAKRPLKVGIAREMRASGFLSRSRVRNLLKHYVSRPTYLACLKTGAARVGLDGLPAGAVTEDQADAARQELTAWRRGKAARADATRRAQQQAALDQIAA